MAPTETPARDAVLVKYLNEAFGKEKQLETSLQALIGRAANHKPLKKGLQDHLKVTKNQARELQKRIRALGGKAAVADVPGPEVATAAASAVTSAANKAVAAAKGPVQMLRGTGEADGMLRGVRDAFWNEGEEIAHYTIIEAVATKLNDRETASLAKRFRREEERMQSFLERQIKALVGEVVREEVPAGQRGTRRRSTSSRSRSRSSSNGASASSSSRSTSSRSTSRSSSSTPKRKAAAQKAAATRTRKAAASSAKSTAKSARTTAKKAGTTAKKTASAARSTAKSARS